jgi:hypothetical protein
LLVVLAVVEVLRPTFTEVAVVVVPDLGLAH